MRPVHCVLFLFSLLFSQRINAQAAVETTWLPLTDAERNQAAPVVDKSAGAEALFWRVHVWDEITGSDWQRHRVTYARIKVFNEAGQKQVTAIEIPYGNNIFVTSVEGRTIQPDGTIVALKKEDVHEREVIRIGGIRRKVKSFAMPAVQPGAIIEYRVREVHFRQNIRYLRAEMQQEYPVQKVTYFVKPMSREFINMRMRVWPFNCKNSPLDLSMNGFSSTTVENLPAFQEEPYMIGEPNVRAWILFLYMEGDRRDADKYWEKRGKEVYQNLRQSLRVNDEIREAAAKAVANAKSDNDKVVAIIAHLRRNLRNLFDASVSDSERAKVIKDMPKDRARTSAEIFKSGIGTADELNTLFAAMAQTVGLEARPALVGDRDGILFDPSLVDSYFLDNIDMAVKIDGQWKIFDATTRLLPPNMIGWREEGTDALVSDSKQPVFVKTPMSTPGESLFLRRGQLSLSAEGTLEGDVALHFTGHAAGDGRTNLIGESAEKRMESVKKLVTAVHPSAEVTNIAVENVDDTAQALTFKYHLRIPGYAQRTGKRLLFAPLFFQQGATPRFSASQRKYPIAFRYAWREDDELRIQLPEGFEMDNGDNPGNLGFDPAGGYQLVISVSKSKELLVGRTLEFGRSGNIMFAEKAYPTLKQIFDEVHRRDGTILSLKQVTP